MRKYFLWNLFLALSVIFENKLSLARGEVRKELPSLSSCVSRTFESELPLAAKKSCERALETLQLQLKESVVSRYCEDLPNLKNMFLEGEKDYLQFHKLKDDYFLMQTTCRSSAYNKSSIFFLLRFQLQEPPAKSAKSNIKALPPQLLLFPTLLPNSTVEAQKIGFQVALGARAFDEKTQRLFAFVKGVGDGRFGVFSVYEFSNSKQLPVLKYTIKKEEDDFKDPYSFELTKEPEGSHWQKILAGSVQVGCAKAPSNLKCKKEHCDCDPVP